MFHVNNEYVAIVNVIFLKRNYNSVDSYGTLVTQEKKLIQSN